MPEAVDVLGEGALGFVTGDEVVGGAEVAAPVLLALSAGAHPKVVA